MRRHTANIPTLLVAVLAALGLGPRPMSGHALTALVAVLVAWPVMMVAVLIRRWSRERDTRFVLAAVLMTVTAAASATGAILFNV